MGRRVFVSSAVAGLPLLAASATRTLAQSDTDTTHVHDGTVVDPVVDHITRQLAATHNAMRRDPRGEHLRAFAAQLRTLAVYGRQSGLDAKLTSAVGVLIARDGRDRVLYAKPDRDQLLAELTRFGVNVDERVLAVESDLDYRRRSAALDGLLKSGLSLRWEQLAAALERSAPEVDRRAATTLRVNRAQDEEYWKGYCDSLWGTYRETQFLAGVICASAALPVIGVLFAGNCIAYQLAAMMFAMAYAGYCWN
jgi:hypothetical protein